MAELQKKDSDRASRTDLHLQQKFEKRHDTRIAAIFENLTQQGAKTLKELSKLTTSDSQEIIDDAEQRQLLEDIRQRQNNNNNNNNNVDRHRSSYTNSPIKTIHKYPTTHQPPSKLKKAMDKLKLENILFAGDQQVSSTYRKAYEEEIEQMHKLVAQESAPAIQHPHPYPHPPQPYPYPSTYPAAQTSSVVRNPIQPDSPQTPVATIRPSFTQESSTDAAGRRRAYSKVHEEIREELAKPPLILTNPLLSSTAPPQEQEHEAVESSSTSSAAAPALQREDTLVSLLKQDPTLRDWIAKSDVNFQAEQEFLRRRQLDNVSYHNNYSGHSNTNNTNNTNNQSSHSQIESQLRKQTATEMQQYLENNPAGNNIPFANTGNDS